jgi:hypothetical protein
MGRPLKIKKIIENSPTNTTGKDIGFNAFNQLTAPVLPVGGAMNTDQFLGVVGGAQPATIATAAYPIVKCRVFVTGFAEADGQIIRQKGAHKYLVADITSRTALVAGRSYRITIIGDTSWASYGAPNAQIGTIFTATAALANTGTGRVNAVGQCVLTSDLSPAAGNMSISFFSGAADSTEQAISKLTNKFLYDFTGGETGGNADTGDVWDYDQVTQNVRFDANFFSDEGYEVKSGTTGATNAAGQQNRLSLAQVEKYTSA